MQKIILLSLVIFISNSCLSQTRQQNVATSSNIEKFNFPEPIGYVNDYACILDSLEIETLETKLKNFDDQTTNQIAIVTLDVNDLTDENFEKYTIALSKYWGVGTKEKNNGLTIILSSKLRRIRINTGLGTEKILTDEICKNVLQNMIIPEFRNQNYFDALDKATDEFIKLWK